MYIVAEGPIGAGKTSLSRILAERIGADLNLEVVEENPFLASFYADKERYALSVQLFFLLSRFKQLSALAQANLFQGSVVCDYLFDKDFIFASMNLRDAEFDLYRELYGQLQPRLAVPDLTVYLRAEPALLLERIAQRGREYERGMDPAYLLELGRRYDEHFERFPHPLLVVEAQELDFVGKAADRERIVGAVLERAAVRVA